jgi:hypothetical protein
LFNQFGYESRPACLVACANAGSVVAMKVFVKIDVVSPFGVRLEFLETSEDWPLPVIRTQENAGQPAGNF